MTPRCPALLRLRHGRRALNLSCKMQRQSVVWTRRRATYLPFFIRHLQLRCLNSGALSRQTPPYLPLGPAYHPIIKIRRLRQDSASVFAAKRARRTDRSSEAMTRQAQAFARAEKARRATAPPRRGSKSWHALRTESARKAKARKRTATAKQKRRPARRCAARKPAQRHACAHSESDFRKHSSRCQRRKTLLCTMSRSLGY